MTRAYSAKLASLAIGVQLKWMDNLLSHHALPGVEQSRQGVERRITDEGLLAIETVRLLTSELGIPLAKAVSIARAAVATRAGGMRFVTETGAVIHFPLADTERRLRERMIEAVEAVAQVPRGRPPLTKKNAER